MNFKYEIKVDDSFPQLYEALERWVERVLTIWGMCSSSGLKKQNKAWQQPHRLG